MLELLAALACLGVIGVFIRWPGFPLALLYNGTAAYFYLMFRAEQQPTPLITGAVLTTLVSCSLIGLIYNGSGAAFRWRIVDTLILSLFVYIVVSVVFMTDHNEWVIRKLSFGPSLAILPYCAGRLLTRTGMFDRFIKNVVVLTSLLAITFTVELGLNFSTQTRFGLFRFGNLDNPILLGLTFSTLLLILYVQLGEGQRKYLWCRVAFMIACIYLILRSGSRGAVTSTICGIICYHSLKKLTMKRMLILFLVCAAAFEAWQVSPVALKEFYLASGEDSEVNSVTRRGVAWGLASDALKDHPIFGRGFGVFKNQFDGSDQGAFAHNVFFEIGAELGVVGLFIFGLILFVTSKRLVLTLRDPRYLTPHRRFELRLGIVLFTQAIVEAQFSGLITQQTSVFLLIGSLWALSEVGERFSVKKNVLLTNSTFHITPDVRRPSNVYPIGRIYSNTTLCLKPAEGK
jgi:O-antigen ligase